MKVFFREVRLISVIRIKKMGADAIVFLVFFLSVVRCTILVWIKNNEAAQ